MITEKRIWRFCLLAVSALLTGLTVVFPKIGFLEWISLIPVGIFLLSYASKPTVRLRALYGWGLFFFYGYYLVTFHWFVNLYPLDFIDGMTHGAALTVVLVAWLVLCSCLPHGCSARVRQPDFRFCDRFWRRGFGRSTNGRRPSAGGAFRGDGCRSDRRRHSSGCRLPRGLARIVLRFYWWRSISACRTRYARTLAERGRRGFPF